jgi:hypothetical protein
MLKINQGESYDVAVIGGGPAGMMAAIASAREGARTVLVERNGYLGGEAATGLPILVYYDQNGDQVMDGLPQEFVAKLQELGGSTGHVFGEKGHTSTMTPLYPEYVKYLAAKMFAEAGGTLFLDTDIAAVETNKKKIKSIIVHNADGLTEIPLKAAVDCTGNGDVIGQSGAAFNKGRKKDGKVQSMTLLFYLGGVDVEEAKKHFDIEWYWGVRPNETKKELIHFAGSLERWRKLAPTDFPFADGDTHMLWAMILRPGLLSINLTDVPDRDPTKATDVTFAEVEVRRQVIQLSESLRKYVPGFKDSYIVGTPARIGMREGRRLAGQYEIQANDVIGGKRFDDSIGRCGYCMDMHDPEGKGISFKLIKGGGYYQLPYRSLVPAELDGLLAAGRCISASHEALASVRVMGPCMVTGQAAGTAAAMAVKQGVEIRDLDVRRLQARLREGKVLL